MTKTRKLAIETTCPRCGCNALSACAVRVDGILQGCHRPKGQKLCSGCLNPAARVHLPSFLPAFRLRPRIRVS